MQGERSLDNQELIDQLRSADKIRVKHADVDNGVAPMTRRYEVQILEEKNWKTVYSSMDQAECQKLVNSCKETSKKKKTFAMKNYNAPDQAGKQVPPVVKRDDKTPPHTSKLF